MCAKLSRRVHFTSRERGYNRCPSPKHSENIFDIFGIGFGVNSQTACGLRLTSLCSVSRLLIKKERRYADY